MLGSLTTQHHGDEVELGIKRERNSGKSLKLELRKGEEMAEWKEVMTGEEE